MIDDEEEDEKVMIEEEEEEEEAAVNMDKLLCTSSHTLGGSSAPSTCTACAPAAE